MEKLRYADLAAEAEKREIYQVEVGCKCFTARLTVSLLTELGMCGQSLQKTVKELSDSQWI